MLCLVPGCAERTIQSVLQFHAGKTYVGCYIVCPIGNDSSVLLVYINSLLTSLVHAISLLIPLMFTELLLQAELANICARW